MNENVSTNCCPKCGAPIPAEAAQGLCPTCVLAGAATPTEIGASPATTGDVPSLERVAAAFPQFEIVELIGRGGMGCVFKARQRHLDRFVALKLLSDKLARDPQFAERFNREGRVLARLNHPNIVSVYDFGQAGDFYFLLMEFVDGVNLREAMRAGRFSPGEALAIVPKICDALQFAHEEGILHRDIKPENILLDAKGRVKIADFGIAKLVGNRQADVTLTATGAALGTPHYMAPEQLEKPSEVDHRADIYSLGVVFYEMLTGELPIGRFAPPSAKATLDDRVDAIVLRALAKERELRQQSAGQMKTEVEGIGIPAAPRHRSNVSATDPTSPKKALSYLSTPEHLRTVTGRGFHPFQRRGELRLTTDRLVFAANGESESIPLDSVRELGTGRHSIGNFETELAYVGISFEENGTRRTRLFTPTPQEGAPLTETNRCVEEWFLAIKNAAQAKTGQTPEQFIPSWSATHAPMSTKLTFLAWILLPGMVGWPLFSILVLGRWPVLPRDLSVWLGCIGLGFPFQGILFGLAHLAMRTGRLDALVIKRPLPNNPGSIAPLWVRRAGILFTVLGGLAFLPTLLSLNSPIREFHSPALLVLTGFALLTRSRIWRGIALWANTLGLLLPLVSLFRVAMLSQQGMLPPGWSFWSWGDVNRGELAVLLMLAQSAAFIAGLWILLRSDVKRLFELPTGQTGTTFADRASAEGSGQSGDLPARDPGAPRWSRKAILSAVLVALSLPMSLVMAFGVVSLGGIPNPSGLFLTFAFGFVPAIAGTLLAWIALGDIRSGHGRLRGIPLAAFAALAWPFLLMLAFLALPPWFALAHTTPMGVLTSPRIAWLAPLVTLAALFVTISIVFVTVRWARGERATRRIGAVGWILVVCSVLFVVGKLARQGRWMTNMPDQAGLPNSREPALAEQGNTATDKVPWIRMTFTSVELREEAGTNWLAMDWVEDVHGDCQHTFRTLENGSDLNSLSRKTSLLKQEKGSPEVRHQRIEWRLPAAVEHADALAFRDQVAGQWRHKSLVVRPGDERILFRLLVPERGTITAAAGAMFLGQAP